MTANVLELPGTTRGMRACDAEMAIEMTLDKFGFTALTPGTFQKGSDRGAIRRNTMTFWAAQTGGFDHSSALERLLNALPKTVMLSGGQVLFWPAKPVVADIQLIISGQEDREPKPARGNPVMYWLRQMAENNQR